MSLLRTNTLPMETLWTVRNIENRSLITDLALTTIKATVINDYQLLLGLTIDANLGGPLVLQNSAVLGTVSVLSDGNINIDSASGTLSLESSGLLQLRSILSDITLVSGSAVNINAPALRSGNIETTGNVRFAQSVAPVLALNSCDIWYPTGASPWPKMSIFTGAQTDYNITLETPTSATVAVAYTSDVGGAWTATANVTYYKVGRLVVLTFSNVSGVVAPAGPFVRMDFALPVGWSRPTSTVTKNITINYDAVTITSGYMTITNLGAGTVFMHTPITAPASPAPAFAVGATCGFLGLTFKYESTY